MKNSQGYVTDERTIANELWDLIRAFYGMYPKYASLNLYITGESYGEWLEQYTEVYWNILTSGKLCMH